MGASTVISGAICPRCFSSMRMVEEYVNNEGAVCRVWECPMCGYRTTCCIKYEVVING